MQEECRTGKAINGSIAGTRTRGNEAMGMGEHDLMTSMPTGVEACRPSHEWQLGPLSYGLRMHCFECQGASLQTHFNVEDTSRTSAHSDQRQQHVSTCRK